MSQEEFNRLENDIIKGRPSLVFRKCGGCGRRMHVNYYASVGIVTKVICSVCSPCECAEITVSIKAFMDMLFERS